MARSAISKAQAIQRVGQRVARGTLGLALDDYYVSDGTTWRITDRGAVSLGHWGDFCRAMAAGNYRAEWVGSSA